MTRIAVITGAGAGVGRAVAEEFARNGWHLALLSRDKDRLEHAAESLIDRYLAKSGYSGQLTDQDLPADAPANLDHPVPGPYGAHGRFDKRHPRTGSWEMFTDRHKMVFMAAAGMLGVLGLHKLAKKLDI